jgi:hypothetical protein
MSETPRQQRNRSSGGRAAPARPTTARRKPGAPFQAAQSPAKKPQPQAPRAPERRGSVRDDEDTVEMTSDEEE